MSQTMPGQSFELCGREIHVWTLCTRSANAVTAKLEAVLSPDERDHAAKFRFEQGRQLAVITRGVLRCLLGRYLGLHPATIRFHYGSKRKPTLACSDLVDFSLARSSGLAAFAFTAGCQLGIDLELIRPLSEMQGIADRFFCPEETAEIMSLPPSERERAFFCCWTRKEAYVKATGDGLSVPLDAFRVAVAPNELAHFVHLAHDMNAAQAWTLHDLCLAQNYAAALAYRDRQRPLSIFRVSDPAQFIERA